MQKNEDVSLAHPHLKSERSYCLYFTHSITLLTKSHPITEAT